MLYSFKDPIQKKEIKMNFQELLIRQLKLQNDLQEENNKLLREILKALIKK